MEDDAQRESLTGQDRADAVTKVRAVVASGALYRAIASRDDDAFTLVEADHSPDRLRTQLLFDEQQFAAGEFDTGAAQADDHLEREEDLAVKILVQAIEVVRPVAQKQRRRARLPSGVACV